MTLTDILRVGGGKDGEPITAATLMSWLAAWAGCDRVAMQSAVAPVAGEDLDDVLWRVVAWLDTRSGMATKAEHLRYSLSERRSGREMIP